MDKDTEKLIQYDNLVKSAFVLGFKEHLRAAGAKSEDEALLDASAKTACAHLEQVEAYKDRQKEAIKSDILSYLSK